MKLIGIKIIKQLFCKHNKAYIEELHYGDVITLYNGKRQRWYCPDCKKIWYK